MAKISAKQVEGVVDLVNDQNIAGNKIFSDSISVTTADDTFTMITIVGAYIYWLQVPNQLDYEGNLRLGPDPNTGTLVKQIFHRIDGWLATQ